MELPITKPRRLVTVPIGAGSIAQDIITTKYPTTEVECTGGGYFETGKDGIHREFIELRIIGEKETLGTLDFPGLYSKIRTAINAQFEWDFVAYGMRFP